jgi:hypothetical protein
VLFRKWLARTCLGTLIATTALISVGLTAPEDGAFSIEVHPVLLRLDRSATEQPRARAIGLDVDIKIGSMHVHFGWSLLPSSSMTTIRAPEAL